MKTKVQLLLDIFLTFLKIGPLTFGGGYAMIPMIEREVVTKKKWLRTEDVADVFAVSESIPGAIGINSATFIGYRIAGIAGAITAMLGVLIPTFTIVILLSICFVFVRNNSHIEAAFDGIRPAIVALIAFAAYKIGQMAIFDKTTFTTTVITAIVLLVTTIHPALVIVAGAILGIILVEIKMKFGMEMKELRSEEHT